MLRREAREGVVLMTILPSPPSPSPLASAATFACAATFASAATCYFGVLPRGLVRENFIF